MNAKDARRVETIRRRRAGELTNAEAAQLLGLDARSIQRLKRKADANGELAVLHAHRGRKAPNAWPDDLKQDVFNFIENLAEPYNYTHLSDTLEESLNIYIARSTLARWMRSNGYESPRKQKNPSRHPRRKRRAQEGELVQLDASIHDWLSQGSSIALHGSIDDATGKVLALFADEQETLDAYYEIAKLIFCRYGLPKAFYTDCRSCFSSPRSKHTIADDLAGLPKTQPHFVCSCQSLGILLHTTTIPQAKGRIERLWGTLQDRLTKEIRRRGIKTIDALNRFLPEFCQRYNKRFAVPATNPTPAYRTDLSRNQFELQMARHFMRKLDHGLSFSYANAHYVLPAEAIAALPMSQAYVTVIDSRVLGLKVMIKDRAFTPILQPTEKRPIAPKRSAEELSELRSRIAKANKFKTPWSQSSPYTARPHIETPASYTGG